MIEFPTLYQIEVFGGDYDAEMSRSRRQEKSPVYTVILWVDLIQPPVCRSKQPIRLPREKIQEAIWPRVNPGRKGETLEISVERRGISWTAHRNPELRCRPKFRRDRV